MTFFIRPAQDADAFAITHCLLALGQDRYTVTEQDVRARLVLLAGREGAVLVADATGAGVIGICHIAGVRNLSTPGYAEIMELAVRADWQGRGAGSALVGAARDWAQHHGFARVRLRSGVHRTEAHAFYEHLGFGRSRASYAFEQTLPD